MSMNPSQKFTYSQLYDTFFNDCTKHINAKQPWCIAVLDYEHFRLFVDVYGDEKGKLLIEKTIELLQNIDQKNGSKSVYFGKDDFAIFMPYNSKIIEEIYEATSKIVSDLGNTHGFKPAIGVHILEKNEAIGWNMIDRASTAVEEAKKHRTDRIKILSEDALQEEKNEYRVLVELNHAVANNEITFYLQPQCRISTKKVVGVEALARWIKADGTVVPTQEYISILEKNGFIGDFDVLIWEKVFQWLSSLLLREIIPVPVSINVSRIDIKTMDVVNYLCDLCEKYQVPHSLIKVEITESAYAEDFDELQDFVADLKAKGFLIMMDDFGSGYSSLNMLENVSVDVVKLDVAFIKESVSSRRSVTIIESIINMAKMMSLPIVVEGVENEEQVKLLKNLGCRYAQGYYFHKPMPAEKFEEILADDKLIDYRGFLCKLNEQYHVREFLDENTFTDTMLNNILGSVAFYSLDGKDLTIKRFNEQFYHSIGDSKMDKRQNAIQNYVVKEDWPSLYRALDNACNNVATGGICEIRFYKSDNSIFWFRLHFFYLKEDRGKKIFYGQVEDVTQAREQSLQLLEIMRENSQVTLLINLDQNKIQYITGVNTLSQVGLPSIDLELSIEKTAEARIDDAEERERFKAFFDGDRLRTAHRKAIYHEKITVNFRMTSESVPVEFQTYYIRHSKDQELKVYVFAK